MTLPMGNSPKSSQTLDLVKSIILPTAGFQSLFNRLLSLPVIPQFPRNIDPTDNVSQKDRLGDLPPGHLRPFFLLRVGLECAKFQLGLYATPSDLPVPAPVRNNLKRCRWHTLAGFFWAALSR